MQHEFEVHERKTEDDRIVYVVGPKYGDYIAGPYARYFLAMQMRDALNGGLEAKAELDHQRHLKETKPL